jgi:hypothetical protein
MSASPDLLYEKIKALPPERINEVVNFIDFLNQRSQKPTPVQHGSQSALLDFPVDHVGGWPDGLSLRREDMYGDDGR